MEVKLFMLLHNQLSDIKTVISFRLMAFPIIWISTKANEMARMILKLIVLTAMIDPK